MTESMKRTVEVTTRRRKLQAAFNKEHGITPETIKKGIPKTLYEASEGDYVTVPIAAEGTRRERIAATLTAMAAAFESLIADAPEQWSGAFFPIWPDLGPAGAAPTPPARPVDDGA